MVSPNLQNPDVRELGPVRGKTQAPGTLPLPDLAQPSSPLVPPEPNTRARLLDAATACFLEAGFAATSMDMVRQRAGVSNGSLYHHFATKQALADALYGQVLREFHGALLVPLASNPPATRLRAQAAVRAFVRTYIEWVVSRPDQARLLAECRRDDRLSSNPEQWTQANRDGFGALAAFIAKGAGSGHLQDVPADVWTALVLGPSIQLTPGWLARGAKTGAVQVAAPIRKALLDAAWQAVAVPLASGSGVASATPKTRMAELAVDEPENPQLPLFAAAAPKSAKVPKLAKLSNSPKLSDLRKSP